MTRQYIGARYVPKFYEGEGGSNEWVYGVPYENLTIVTHLGNTYTSKKPVPVGVQIDNTEYWVITGNYNAQVEEYRKEVSYIKAKLDGIKFKTDVDLELVKDNKCASATNTKKIMQAFSDGYGVFLSNGTYYCETITMKNGDVLIGENKIHTVIKNTCGNGVVLSLSLDEMNEDYGNHKIWSNFCLTNLSITSDTMNGYGVYIMNKTFEIDANSDLKEYEKIVGHLYGFELRNSVIRNLYINGFANGLRVGGFTNTAYFDNFFIENCNVGCEVYGSDNKFVGFNITFCSYGFNLDGPFNTISTSKFYMIGTGTYTVSGSYGLYIGTKAYSSFVEMVDIQECGEIGCAIINTHAITLNLSLDSNGLVTSSKAIGLYMDKCHDIVGNVQATNLRKCQNFGINISNCYNLNISYVEDEQLSPLSHATARYLNTSFSTVDVYRDATVIGYASANYSEFKINCYFTASATIPANTDLFDIDLLSNKSVQLLVPGSDKNVYTLYNVGSKVRCFSAIPNGVSLFANTVSEYSVQ